jgi:hypothetical protein
MQGQSNQSQQAQAQAAAQIAQYNSQLQSAANQYNTQNANTAQASNLANAQDIENQNVTGANQRLQYNAQVPQTLFQDQMQKAQGIAGAYGNQAELKQKQNQMNAGLTGGLIGAGATVLGGMYGGPAGAVAAKTATTKTPTNYNDNPYGNYAQGGVVEEQPTMQHPIQSPHTGNEAVNQLGQHAPSSIQNVLKNIANLTKNSPVSGQVKPGYIGATYTKKFSQGGMCYAQGGEVHDHELCMQAGGDVPGDDQAPPMQDSEANDTVHANLSPGEIVLPRSVAQAPDAPQQAQQFVSQTKGQPPMGGGASFADVLAQLEANGIELRLASKGQ